VPAGPSGGVKPPLRQTETLSQFVRQPLRACEQVLLKEEQFAQRRQGTKRRKAEAVSFLCAFHGFAAKVSKMKIDPQKLLKIKALNVKRIGDPQNCMKTKGLR
jgi:hypothetical protein